MEEKITTFGSPLDSRASLETIPLEILNHIFVLTCSEDLDLSLLYVSGGITWKLLGHPISRTVRAFWPAKRHGWSNERLLTNSSPFSGNGSVSVPGGRGGHIDERRGVQQEVLASAWCTPVFMRRLQIAFIRRMVKAHWDPFLERDGLNRCATSHAHFWDTLDRLAQDDTRTADGKLEISLTDSETRYSWTRIRIWPWKVEL